MTRIERNLSPVTGPVPLTPESRTGDFSGGGLLFSYVQNRPRSSYGLAKLRWIRCSRKQAVPLSEYATRGHRQGSFLSIQSFHVSSAATAYSWESRLCVGYQEWTWSDLSIRRSELSTALLWDTCTCDHLICEMCPVLFCLGSGCQVVGFRTDA